MKKVVLLVVLLLAAIETSAAGPHRIIFVDSQATGIEQNGARWATAFTDLQDGLTAASAGDEIWVAAGVYTPSASDRDVSFTMKDGVAVYGGFSGVEVERGERDWERNETILSGEIGSPGSIEDNSRTVVMAANGVLDGFTVRDGYGLDGNQQGTGDGVALYGVFQGGSERGVGHLSPEAILRGAPAPGTGAGIQVWQVSPEIRNCRIVHNSAGKAGGIYIVGNGPERPGTKADKEEAVPLFLNCIIANNTAVKRGGGVAIDMGGRGLFIDCLFSENSCKNGKGGAMYNDFGCSPYIANCLFVNNTAESGAAVANDGTSNPVIYNSTLYGNIASAAGGGLYQGSGPFNDPTVVNTIIWGNICLEDEASIYNWNDSNAHVSYSLVEGGYGGTAILESDPLFVDAEGGNFNLQGDSPARVAGRISDRIGYNAAETLSRTKSEIKKIKEFLDELPVRASPKILDLANPLSLSDIRAESGVFYVKPGAGGSGSSWADASGSIQDCIDKANRIFEKTGVVVQLWIGEGTYLTGESRSDSFIMRPGVKLYGGFRGDETTLSQRDVTKHRSILSGDIGVPGEKFDNSYHVLIGSNNAVLDGFTITGGYADRKDGEVYDNKGGGILNYHGGYRIRPNREPVLGFNTVVRNCLFTNNYAEEGGAAYTYHGGSPSFENCQFIWNSAKYGGAAVDRGGVNSRYYHCDFMDNSALYKGSGVFVDYGSMATFDSCSFTSNVAGASGGAIYVIDRASRALPNETDIGLINPDWFPTTDIFSSALIRNCSFKQNCAGVDGGALYIYESGQAKITGSLFEENQAGRNGDIISLVNSSSLYLGMNNSFRSADEGISAESNSVVINE